jgi:hypothetical protein
VNLSGSVQTTVRSPTFRVDESCSTFDVFAGTTNIKSPLVNVTSGCTTFEIKSTNFNIFSSSFQVLSDCSNFNVKATNTNLTETIATATTQPTTDNSTKLATTAFVNTAVNNSFNNSTKNVTFGIVTATSFNASSDYRIKSNITSLDETYNVDNLKPVTYLNKQTDKQDIGLIAHELQEKYPILVNGTKDGDAYQSINYIGLIPVLIKEIQTLKQTVTDLNQRIKTLEEKP